MDDRPENIPGYEEPPEFTYQKGNMYATFNQHSKKAKYNFGTVSKEDVYKKSCDYVKDSTDECPQCGLASIRVSRCVNMTRECKNGHHWYTGRDGIVRLGNPAEKNICSGILWDKITTNNE